MHEVRFQFVSFFVDAVTLFKEIKHKTTVFVKSNAVTLSMKDISFSFSFLNVYTGYKISVKDNCFTN